MELGLSLGEAPPARAFSPPWKSGEGADLRLGFAVGSAGMENERRRPAAGPPVQLSLLPFCPVPRLASSSSSPPPVGVDVNQAAPSSPSGDGEKGSDDDESGRTRKKLRLSKEQSAFLEESFREHNTLNPKQKIALAKQLNLRPRQVEVWFQNRRARCSSSQSSILLLLNLRFFVFSIFDCSSSQSSILLLLYLRFFFFSIFDSSSSLSSILLLLNLRFFFFDSSFSQSLIHLLLLNLRFFFFDFVGG
ncbi:uncharacterized protein LOC144713817 isoform X1 [Wolffia australiana]